MRLFVHAPVLLGLAAACTPSPSPLAWTIDFAPGAPRPPEVHAVRAWIRAGGCGGADAVYSVTLEPDGSMAPMPPVLHDGVWGFGADALDAQCRVVASACEDVELPSSAAVMLSLRSLLPPTDGCGPEEVCSAGACVAATDADGGVDASTPDGGAADADGGTTDAGPSCASVETDCQDARDDDCDGTTDCGDADCAGQRCASGGTCQGGVCCTGCASDGECVEGTDDAACGSGGGVCAECAECTECAAGSCEATAAGTACTGGRCTGGTSPICCTGCLATAALTCEPGTSDSACGSGGDACLPCGSGETCLSGSCEDVCTGCVTSTGACRAGLTNVNCGTDGEPCVTCGTGDSCIAATTGTGGMCVTGTP